MIRRRLPLIALSLVLVNECRAQSDLPIVFSVRDDTLRFDFLVVHSTAECGDQTCVEPDEGCSAFVVTTCDAWDDLPGIGAVSTEEFVRDEPTTCQAQLTGQLNVWIYQDSATGLPLSEEHGGIETTVFPSDALLVAPSATASSLAAGDCDGMADAIVTIDGNVAPASSSTPECVTRGVGIGEIALTDGMGVHVDLSASHTNSSRTSAWAKLGCWIEVWTWDPVPTERSSWTELKVHFR